MDRQTVHVGHSALYSRREKREVATLRTALEGLMLAYERRIRSNCTPEQLEQKPWRVAEYCIAEEALTNKEPLAKVEDGGNNGKSE